MALVVIVAAVVVLPLTTIYRSTGCEGRSVRYSFVPPWNEPPADCRDHDNGLQFIWSELSGD